MKDYDLVVVGAGPAGSAAAKAAAEKGIKTVLLEEHAEIGVPAHCSGGIIFFDPVFTREILGAIDRRVIIREYKATRVYAPSGKVVMTVPTKEKTTFLVDRAQFDQEVARLAVNAGADLLLHVRATGLLRKNGNITGVTTSSASCPEIKSKVVIAADGINAIQKGIPNWAGLTPAGQRYWGGISLELTRVKGLDPDVVEMHLGAFTKSGYTGVLPSDATSCMTHFETMEEFQRVKTGNYALSEKFREAIPLKIVGYRHTWNLGERLPRITTNGLILTGSAAGWRGTINSYFTGMHAGQMAAEAIRDNDVSENKLNQYGDILARKMSRGGYQFKSKVDVYPFNERSDAEIEKLLMEMIARGEFKLPS